MTIFAGQLRIASASLQEILPAHLRCLFLARARGLARRLVTGRLRAAVTASSHADDLVLAGLAAAPAPARKHAGAPPRLIRA
jgi:hypothetical protein